MRAVLFLVLVPAAAQGILTTNGRRAAPHQCQDEADEGGTDADPEQDQARGVDVEAVGAGGDRPIHDGADHADDDPEHQDARSRGPIHLVLLPRSTGSTRNGCAINATSDASLGDRLIVEAESGGRLGLETLRRDRLSARLAGPIFATLQPLLCTFDLFDLDGEIAHDRELLRALECLGAEIGRMLSSGRKFRLCVVEAAARSQPPEIRGGMPAVGAPTRDGLGLPACRS